MISIIIPTYNRPLLLERLLRSIEKQTFQNFEILVMDDFSLNREENKAICLQFPKVTYICKTENSGPQRSRNMGIKKSQFDILCFTDDDDTWEDTKLEKQLEKMRSKDEYSLIYTWANVVDENGVKIGEMSSQIEGNIQKHLLEKNSIPSSSVMVQKKCFLEVWDFDESFPSCQDWDMWYRVSKKFSIGVVKEPLINYYKHDSSSVGKNKNASLWYILFVKKYWLDFIKSWNTLSWLKHFLYGCKNYFGIWN